MGILKGDQVPFRSAADRKALIGRDIDYLRECDIDKSGRGLAFPRFGTVADASGRFLIMDNGEALAAGDLREVVLSGRPSPANEAKQGPGGSEQP